MEEMLGCRLSHVLACTCAAALRHSSAGLPRGLGQVLLRQSALNPRSCYAVWPAYGTYEGCNHLADDVLGMWATASSPLDSGHQPSSGQCCHLHQRADILVCHGLNICEMLLKPLVDTDNVSALPETATVMLHNVLGQAAACAAAASSGLALASGAS